MRTFATRGRIVVLGACISVWTILTACTVEEENPATPRKRSTSSTLDGSTSTEGGSSTPTGAPLCEKYGGADGVKEIASAIIANAKADCRISPEISRADSSGKHFKECFQSFVATGFQCPGFAFSLGQTKVSDDKTCNSQMPGVQFTNRDFNTLTNEVIKKTLEEKGLTADEIRQIAPVFEGARLKLVNNNSNSRHEQCAANCSIGGDACVRIIDAGPDVNEPPPDSGAPDAEADSGDDEGDPGEPG